MFHVEQVLAALEPLQVSGSISVSRTLAFAPLSAGRTGQAISGTGAKAARKAERQENCRGRNASDCAAARKPPGNVAACLLPVERRQCFT